MALIAAIDEFLAILSEENKIILDVRSELEFAHGNIPGAVNIPLLNNEHRALVGTTYKKKGREAAVIEGFELVGGKFAEMIKQVNKLSADKKVLVYCW